MQMRLKSEGSGFGRKFVSAGLSALRNAISAERRSRRRFLRGDLAENGAQFVKVHRLGQMKIETGFFAALNIVRCPKPSERYGFNRSFSLGLGNRS